MELALTKALATTALVAMQTRRRPEFSNRA
jgi:hypothetical protein